MLTHRTILVISDSNGSDHNYRQQLQQDESIAYRVLSEPDSSIALRLSQSQQLDGILLELHPHSDNIKLLRQLKEQMRDRCPPIVVVDSGSTESVVEAFKNGAVDYLVSDRITPEDLRLAMRTAIGNAELRRELQQSQEQFQTSVENMLDCFGIFSAIRDATGKIDDFRIDYLNTAACQNNQMPKEMQIGRGLCEVLSAHRESGLFDEYCQVVETGEPLIKDSLIYDDTYGDRRLVRAFDIRVTKLNDGFVASWRDVTDRRLTELKLSQTVTELEASQQRQRDLAEAMPQIVWTADATGAVNYLNQRWYDYTGLSEAESMGLDGIIAVHPDDRDRTLAQWGHSITKDTAFEIEYRIQNRAGEYHWFICRAMPTRDRQGQITTWIGTITDIHSQKQTQEKLRQSEERLALALSSAQAGMWQWFKADNRTIWSEENYRLLGYEPGCTASTYEAWLNAVHPDDRKRVQQSIDRAIAEQSSLHLEYRICLPDGSIRWVVDRGQLTYDVNNQPDGMIGILFDITEHKQAETKLQRNQERLDLAMKAAGMGSWDWDIQTDRVYWSTNLEHLFGMAPGYFDGQYETFKAMIHPNDLPWFEQAIDRALYQRKDYNIEFRFIKPDGTVRWAVGLGRVFYDAIGNPVAMTGVDMDITERKQVEAALRSSEARFRDMADNAPGMIWVTDPTGCCTYLNQGWYDFTGQTEVTGLGFGWLDAVHPDDSQASRDIFLSANERREAFQLEYRLRRHDGTYRWAIDAANPWFGEDGEFKGFIGSVIDIDDRKQAEEAMRLSEERYRTLFETMDEGFCVIEMLFDQHNTPLDYRFLEVNPVFEQQTGLEQVEGKTARQLLPDLESYWFEMYGKVALTGEAVHFEHGSEVMNRWFDVSAFRIGQPESRKVAILFQDISDRKQTEAALRQSENRLRLALESAELGTWDFNPITQVLKWDDQCKAMFGLSPQAEITYDVFLAGLHADDRDRTHQVVLRAFDPESGGEYDIEYRTVGLEDGIERWIAAKGKAFFNPAEEVIRFIGTVLNITEKKRAEAEREQLLRREQAARADAERANRIKDEFLAVLSHELRSPLNPILGWTKLLQTRKFSESQKAQALATIERNAKLQTQLIDDLLDVAKILRGKLSLNADFVNLSSVIESAIDTVKTTAVAKSISLSASLLNLGQVSGDAARLQQVVWNLLSNAIKFTPDGGQVDIQLKQVGQQAEITVRDTGKGINPSFLPYIFESFRQEDASITRKYGGLGLGLAIVRQLVEAHGGTITAENLGEGFGATFIVRLPLLKTAPELKPLDETPQQNLDLTGIRVLAIDDDPDARELLAVLLTEYGAEVLTVTSVVEVLASLKSFQPDVLVSDIAMPGIDGYSLIQQVRALPSTAGGKIPAIALTAHAREADHQRAIQSGYQKHVTKPLDPERLVQAIVSLTRKAS